MINEDKLLHNQQKQVEDNMSNITSASGDQASVSSCNRNEIIGSNYHYNINNPNQPQDQCFVPQIQSQKKKRNQPGNPDPEAEVLALSPKTLMATNRFICEICNKGFQRDQNLQLHKRGHNLPWKLKQRTNKDVIIKKKVYVCPEPNCVHNHPSRALGDLTGIKKHFFRKHGEKKWKCDKCCKKYAVQSDFKAHSKTCGTKEYKCDCGTLFSRRDSFITHRAFCDALAQESAKATPTNPNLIPSNHHHHHHHDHDQTQHNINFSSSSSQLNLHDGHDMKQEEPHHNFNNNIPSWLVTSSNPNNSNLFPLASSTSNFHHHSSPAMSATALLQKAAQMGPKTSTKQGEEEEEEEERSRSSRSYNNTMTTMASMMTSPASYQDHYYMTNHEVSHDHHHHQGGLETFNGGFVAGNGGGETRDFLGLRPLMSHNEIISFANDLGKCINTSASEQQHEHHGD